MPDFGCAYIPCSSEVSPLLEDPATTQLLGLDADGQLRFFLALAQLAGHPLIYDVLPQTGRFSALVLSNPSLVRWFDVPALIAGLTDAAETLLADVPDVAEAAVIRANWLAELHGRAATPTACSEISAQLAERWLAEKQRLSQRMMAWDVRPPSRARLDRSCARHFSVKAAIRIRQLPKQRFWSARPTSRIA